jgi:hypothetical protein
MGDQLSGLQLEDSLRCLWFQSLGIYSIAGQLNYKTIFVIRIQAGTKTWIFMLYDKF